MYESNQCGKSGLFRVEQCASREQQRGLKGNAHQQYFTNIEKFHRYLGYVPDKSNFTNFSGHAYVHIDRNTCVCTTSAQYLSIRPCSDVRSDKSEWLACVGFVWPFLFVTCLFHLQCGSNIQRPLLLNKRWLVRFFDERFGLMSRVPQRLSFLTR